ncbi:ras GTPase [Piedraia hortae CBS 480.64]|uniref:Ras GTPase n=1 Tax=Piedraia hortae CBS 480.64 TaxID=1314780 RepID=A0A6A7C5F7_9PEZI|nr:ras GTPase [Piedraia hortae CBS 480.64]
MASYGSYKSPTSPPGRYKDHSPTKSSPLRHALSTVSHGGDGTVASRMGLDDAGLAPAAHKRARSESPVKKNAVFAKWEQREQLDSTPMQPPSRRTQDDGWRNDKRSALAPVGGNPRLDRPTAPKPTTEPGSPTKENRDLDTRLAPAPSVRFHEPLHAGPASRNSLATFSRSDSVRGPPKDRSHGRYGSIDTTPHLDGEDLAKLQKSSTPQLRHLSKLASERDELGIHSRDEQVVGLAGRKKLQRADSVRPSEKGVSKFGSQFASTRWMDMQRKHLQAYEYLCHIGEARAWLEDVLEPVELPPIVQLEEALRDGVTLAEVVVRLSPRIPSEDQRALGSLRIFRSPRLQYRHTDNIALFFRFLAAIDLPELFRFETVDLYEKKNIPKVIYCIHALSWLLYRKGVVEFRIGNLVGQLQFEEHELEETQKGIDRSGVAMPNFGGMREAMQVEPEPEPTPEEMLASHEELIVDLQAQVRGAVLRNRLGDLMQNMWDHEDRFVHLQAVARGWFAREIFAFKFGMDHSTRQFQAAAKSFLVRASLNRKQHNWRNNALAVVKVQSLWRGRQQRAQTKQVKVEMYRQRQGVRQLQSMIRGALARWRAGDVWEATHSDQAEADVAALQAQIRGAMERLRVGAVMEALWDREPTIEMLQAAARGVQVRKRAKGQKVAAKEAAVHVVKLQAALRGLIQRKEVQRHHGHFEVHSGSVVHLQAAARGLLQRLQQARLQGALQGRESNIVKLQSALRTHMMKKEVDVQKKELSTTSANLASLQAVARARNSRQRTEELRRQLAQHESSVVHLQALGRAMTQRRIVGNQLVDLEKEESQIAQLQALTRAYIERQRVFQQLIELEKEEEGICQLQAIARARLLCSQVGLDLADLESCEDEIAALQAATRAFMVRSRFEEKRQYFRENMQKVVKLQSFVRAKQQGESYKSLVAGKNPPLPVVRRHLHLLTDTDLEFESEIEAERLRRQVMESVRRNELVESYVEGLDVKIALLVKNKITLDEVVKHQKHYGGSASQLLRQKTVPGSHSRADFDLKALNKNSRKRLSNYEELFLMLQTQPQYLSCLLHQLGSQGMAEKDAKNLERLIITMFGHVQKAREEYFFLLLLDTCNNQLVAQSRDVSDYMRNQSGAFTAKLVHNYVRRPMVRAYLKTLMGGMVKEGICGQEHLDLESDPLQIYRAILNNEELSTGQTSRRPREIPREVAIREPDVRETFRQHLQDLRDICDGFFLNLEECIHRMPFGMRHLMAEQYRALTEQFTDEDPGYMATLVGHWLWKSYLLPALREPEMWGVVDRGLSPIHKRNLGQVIAVLGQVTSGRLFGNENMYLQPLNNWITESMEKWHESLYQMFDIPSAEEYFDADQFSDLYARTKPTLYIKLSDIFAIHSLVADNLNAIAPQRDAPIRALLTDLGTVKSNENDLGNASSGGEITLTLKSRFTVQEDPSAEARALFMATKRLVLHVIKVQTGNSLLEILCRPITPEDAEKWVQVLREEGAERDRGQRRHHRRTTSNFDPRASIRGAKAQSIYSEAQSTHSEDRRDLLDLQSMTFAELKHSALENIVALEKPNIPPQYRVSRHNNYQDILNALAADIRQKHRRRMERQQDIEATRATLAQLDTKATYLEEQLQSYNDYIEQCLHTLASKKGNKHKFMLPFTKQWSHQRELERAGRQPKFGSYKYSARQLADKGVLLSWEGFSPEHWGHLNVVISSDEVGVFHLEASSGSMMLPGASAHLLLDELLQAQFDNLPSVAVFGEMSGGGAKLNVNLLLHLVFKKFYRDE